jgi:beta-mannosidase
LNYSHLKKYPDAQLYYVLIPMILRQEGDKRYYQPSSPYSPDNSDPNNNFIGDQHPWDIGFTDKDYYKYRSFECRFPNEGGVLGPTSYPNTMACLAKGDEYVGSFTWELHNNTISINNPQDKLVREKFGADVSRFTIKDYIYYAGLGQGEGLTEYILNFRRRMYDTASAIVWMYNDTWPDTNSWTIVDYMRLRTPSFYPVKRAFAPVAVNIVRTADGCDIYAINERLHTVHASLEYGTIRESGYPFTDKSEVTLAPNTSAVIAHIPFVQCGEDIPYAILEPDGEPVSRRRLIEKAMTPAPFQPSDIRVEYDGDTAVYTSDRFVLGICIDLDGSSLSDNFFDLYPGKSYTVKLNGTSGKVLYGFAPEY